MEFALVDLCGCRGGIDRGGRDFVGGFAARNANAGRAAGCGPSGFAGSNHAGGKADGRRASGASRASAEGGEPVFCGCDGERSADGKPRAGTRVERRDRKARFGSSSGGRGGTCGTASASSGKFAGVNSRDGAADGARNPRPYGAPTGRNAVRGTASGSERRTFVAQRACAGDGAGRSDSGVARTSDRSEHSH